MTHEEFAELLRSDLPSERLSAAQWAVTHDLSAADTDLLVTAVAVETVTRVKIMMNQALGPMSLRGRRVERAPEPARGSAAAILGDLSGIIRHELAPPIGWISSAANRDIENFEASRTSKMINALLRRVAGLSDLAAAYRQPQVRPTSINEILRACIDNESIPAPLVNIKFGPAAQDLIMSDPDLLELLLFNVLRNAAEACLEVGRSSQVLVTVGGEGSRFWIRVTNPTQGKSFDYAAVAATGRTTKDGHRGLGTRVIELAAGALGYRFRLAAENGEAIFILEGERNV